MRDKNQDKDKMEETHKYDDIINLPYRKSRRHPQMPRTDRAAQFAPFAALTGYEETIRQTQNDVQHEVLNEIERKILD